MKQEVDPKIIIAIVAVLVVLIAGIGYKVFFTRPANVEAAPVKPGAERFMHPSDPGSPPGTLGR